MFSPMFHDYGRWLFHSPGCPESSRKTVEKVKPGYSYIYEIQRVTSISSDKALKTLVYFDPIAIFENGSMEGLRRLQNVS